MMEQADFAAKAREIFLALGVQEDALQAYSGLMDEMKGDGAEQEVNVCAYILRRDNGNTAQFTADAWRTAWRAESLPARKAGTEEFCVNGNN